MKAQKYPHLYLQVFVVGAGQTLESHHESCTLKHQNTKFRLGWTNIHREGNHSKPAKVRAGYLVLNNWQDISTKKNSP